MVLSCDPSLVTQSPADIPKESSPLLPPPNDRSRISAHPSSSSYPRHGDEEAQQNTNEIDDLHKTELRRRVIWISPALGIGLFLSAVDLTIVASAYGEIGSDLNALNNTSWIATAYFLTVTAFQPLYGKLSDIFGRKLMLLFAYAIFSIGCLFCGLARSMTELVLARALAGIGGGGLTTLVAILLSDVATMRERGTWQGYVNITFGIGAALGSCVGGVLVDSIGWRWIFLLQAPLTCVAFAAVFSLLKMPHKNSSNWMMSLKRIDFLGTLVLLSATFSLLFGLDWGSNHFWRSVTTLGCLCSSLVLFLVFVAVEAKLVSEPIAPTNIVFKSTLFACYLSNFFSHVAFLPTLYNIPLYFQAADGLSATQAGFRVLPAVISSMFGSVIAGFVMQRIGRYYVLNLWGYISMVVGLLLILLFTGLVSKHTWAISIGLVFAGYSEGSTIVSTLLAQISNVSRDEQAIATACSYLFRTLGSVVGISLGASMMQHFLRGYLHQSLANNADVESIMKHVRESLDYIDTIDPSVAAVVRTCYANALRVAFTLNLCFAAVSVCTSWFIKDKDLH